MLAVSVPNPYVLTLPTRPLAKPKYCKEAPQIQFNLFHLFRPHSGENRNGLRAPGGGVNTVPT
jgi:hypothetical protein